MAAIFFVGVPKIMVYLKTDSLDLETGIFYFFLYFLWCHITANKIVFIDFNIVKNVCDIRVCGKRAGYKTNNQRTNRVKLC